MNGVESQRDYYDLLGLKPTASVDEIRRRYKFLVLAFHPDRFARTPEHHMLAEQQIKQINEAYKVLSDPQARTRYDLARLSGLAAAPVVPNAPALQRELEQARVRIHQLEQETVTLRTRLEVVAAERTALQRQLQEREREHREAQQALDAEAKLLALQLDQLGRERLTLDNLLKEQLAQANQKAAQLTQELAGRERLLENLAANKAEWERSSQSRLEMLSQQVRRLQEEVARREATLAEQRHAHANLEERLLRVEREAKQSAQNLTNALRLKQQESESLQVGVRTAADAQLRERRAVRLWQVVAIIAILNTLVLLALYVIG